MECLGHKDDVNTTKKFVFACNKRKSIERAIDEIGVEWVEE